MNNELAKRSRQRTLKMVPAAMAKWSGSDADEVDEEEPADDSFILRSTRKLNREE